MEESGDQEEQGTISALPLPTLPLSSVLQAQRV